MPERARYTKSPHISNERAELDCRQVFKCMSVCPSLVWRISETAQNRATHRSAVQVSPTNIVRVIFIAGSGICGYTRTTHTHSLIFIHSHAWQYKSALRGDLDKLYTRQFRCVSACDFVWFETKSWLDSKWQASEPCMSSNAAVYVCFGLHRSKVLEMIHGFH